MRTKNKLSVRLLSVLLTLCLLAGFSGIASVPAYASTSAVTAQDTTPIATYALTKDPCALNITFYTDYLSRGFAWQTTTENDVTELWLVESNQGQNATFSGDPITGTCEEATYDSNGKIISTTYNATYSSAKGKNSLTFNYHLVHKTSLKPGTTYSYKVGGDEHYKYGTFTTESENADAITILNFNDAQTKKSELLYKWQNTVTQAFSTVSDVDFILYGGDQFDANMEDYSGTTDVNELLINRLTRYEAAKDTIASVIGSTPYMSCTGNHDPYLPYGQVITSDISWGGTNQSGGYYSFDYQYAHFVILDSNLTSEALTAQVTWLENDLANTDEKWVIVMIHNGPYATGDHSNDSNSQRLVTTLTPIFAEYEVDLVLQAHDHTYSKTLPYLWTGSGYSTSYDDNGTVVNLNPTTTVVDGVTYDLNPNGTYYVSAGAAGHRAGSSEGDAGIWSDVSLEGYNKDITKNSELNGLCEASSNNGTTSFTENTYKIEVGKINYSNSYTAFDSSVGGKNYTNNQVYTAGDPASANVNAQMFGALTITEDTLTYNFYTVEGSTVKLFDTLNVLKSDSNVTAYTGSVSSANDESSIMALLTQLWEDSGLAKLLSADTWNTLREKVASIITSIETGIKTALASLNSGSSADSELVAVQSSVTDGTFAARFIGGTAKTEDELEEYEKIGFEISADSGSGFTETKTVYCKEIYTSSVLNDGTYEITNSISASDGQNLFALTISGISTDGTVVFKIKPFMIDEDGNTNYGAERTVTFEYGFYKSVE